MQSPPAQNQPAQNRPVQNAPVRDARSQSPQAREGRIQSGFAQNGQLQNGQLRNSPAQDGTLLRAPGQQAPSRKLPGQNSSVPNSLAPNGRPGIAQARTGSPQQAPSRPGGARSGAPVAPAAGAHRPEPSAADLFPSPAAATPPRGSSASSPPRPPGTPFRGFRQPSGGTPSRLVLVAASLAVLIVLTGVVFGVQQLSSRGSASSDSLVTAAPDEPVGATQPGETPGALATASADPTVEPTEADGPTTGAASKVELGVFLGTSPSDMREFGKWLGRKPEYALDFPSRSTWKEISDPAYTINTWSGSDYRMVYSVAMLPWNGNTSIKAGAQGDYDQYYRRLAQNLVAGGQEDAILRIGWEFNLKGWKWSTDNPKDFIGYWRHIVTAMRSVPGEKLRFDWNPNVGDTPYDAQLYYPGNKYVDYIGIDVYDVSWEQKTYPYGYECNAKCRLYRQEDVWNRLENGTHGLSFWADFARTKGKPMSIPEWGLWDRPDGHGGGDNPYFVKKMFAFIDDPHNRVAYQGYLQVDVADGNHKLTTLKQAGKAYKKLFK